MTILMNDLEMIQDLDAETMAETRGGLGFLAAVGAGLLIAAGTKIINDQLDTDAVVDAGKEVLKPIHVPL